MDLKQISKITLLDYSTSLDLFDEGVIHQLGNIPCMQVGIMMTISSPRIIRKSENSTSNSIAIWKYAINSFLIV